MLWSTRVKEVTCAGIVVPNQRMNVSVSPVESSRVVKADPSATDTHVTVPVKIGTENLLGSPESARSSSQLA
jgi:hypothetical protein